MSGAVHQPVHGDTVTVQLGSSGSSFSSTIPSGVCDALGLDGDSRLRWRFDPPDDVEPFTGAAAVNVSGPSSLEATIPAWVRRGMGITADSRLNWHCEGLDGPAKVLVVGSGQPPAVVLPVED